MMVRASNFAVVGNGPIGASVARALARHGHTVDLFSSPALWSSHDDCGRITRVIDYEGAQEWIRWNTESLRVWRSLEEQSGLSFFHQVGSIVMVPNGTSRFEDQLDGVEFRYMDCQELSGRGVHIEKNSADSSLIFEPMAGYVNPRDLIKAQNKILLETTPATGRNSIHYETVVQFQLEYHSSDRVNESLENQKTQKISVLTAEHRDGPRYFDNVILCAGAFTNDLLSKHYQANMAASSMPVSDGTPPASLPYKVSRRTVLLGEVSEEVKDGPLRNMPALKLSVETETPLTGGAADPSVRDLREASSVYVLPPIWYEEYGGWFVKIGGGPNDFVEGQDVVASIQAWHQSEYGNEEQLVLLRRAMNNIFPHVPFLSWRTKNCITTTAGDEGLFQKEYYDGKVFVVANCQGKAVMASAAIGDELARRVGGVV